MWGWCVRGLDLSGFHFGQWMEMMERWECQCMKSGVYVASVLGSAALFGRISAIRSVAMSWRPSVVVFRKRKFPNILIFPAVILLLGYLSVSISSASVDGLVGFAQLYIAGWLTSAVNSILLAFWKRGRGPPILNMKPLKLSPSKSSPERHYGTESVDAAPTRHFNASPPPEDIFSSLGLNETLDDDDDDNLLSSSRQTPSFTRGSSFGSLSDRHTSPFERIGLGSPTRNTVSSDMMKRRTSELRSPFMNGVPALRRHASDGVQKREDIVLAPPRFVAPSRMTGLEELFEKSLNVKSEEDSTRSFQILTKTGLSPHTLFTLAIVRLSAFALRLVKPLIVPISFPNTNSLPTMIVLCMSFVESFVFWTCLGYVFVRTFRALGKVEKVPVKTNVFGYRIPQQPDDSSKAILRRSQMVIYIYIYVCSHF
ncbi:hypothetical protein BC829DRAFT_95375 [Chytridium lagenaria]|nr:hypothetical protein BC829DRAFT_95375 [Chytridium lagenaria]